MQYNPYQNHNGIFGRNRKIVFNMVIKTVQNRKINLERKDQSWKTRFTCFHRVLQRNRYQDRSFLHLLLCLTSQPSSCSQRKPNLAFAPAVPSSWHALPADVHAADLFWSFGSQFKCTFLREDFPTT